MKYLSFIVIFLITFFINNEAYGDEQNLITKAVENPNRGKEDIYRDKYRNPLETLNFFGLDRKMKVLEVIPGRGWYTKIISNYMKSTNNFYVATYENPPFATEIITKIQKEFFNFFRNNIENFGEIKSTKINKDFKLIGYNDYFDMILTFRNTHNFLDQNKSKEIFKSFHKSLKKGGVLGVVQHRANEISEFNYKKGYVKESFLINHIEQQGFSLLKKSEINANPRDIKNYEKGVWTLPPRYTEGAKNRSLYTSIGESDRMTLKFIKK